MYFSGIARIIDYSQSIKTLIQLFTFQTLSDRETAPGQMDEMDIEKLKEYDMELERALRELEVEMPGAFHNQM